MASSKKVTVKPEAKAVVPVVKPAAPKTEEKVTANAVAKTEEKKAETPAAAAKAVLASEKKEAAKPGRKPAEKKTAAKKPGRKPAAKKADLKASVCVQFSGKSYTQEELVKMARDVWKYDLKQKVGELESIELYVKPEENVVYYVMNKDFAGNFYI